MPVEEFQKLVSIWWSCEFWRLLNHLLEKLVMR